MLNKFTSVYEQPEHPKRMFAKFGEGHWYAILPGMESSFRKLGAVVQTMPDTQDSKDGHQ